MAISRPAFPQKYYALRYENAVVDASVGASGPDAASLAALEAVMLDAHRAYWQRRYQDAIAAYQKAASEIYALIDPQFDHRVVSPAPLPHSPALFEAFVSVAAEYLNVLPVHQPAAGGRARVPVDPALLGGKGASTGLGVESMQLGSRNAAGALASWRLAQNYTALGMPESAAYFAAQARVADPKVAEELELASAPRAPQGAGPAKQGVSQGDGGSGAKGTTQAPVSAPQALPALSTEALLSDVPVAHISDAMEAGTRTPLPPAFMEGRSATTLRGSETVRLAWEGGSAAPPTAIISNLYQARIDLQTMPDGLLAPLTPSDVALSLPHLYYYVIPLAIAECHHALGDYASAETSYLLAASYRYINLAVEAPYLWTRLATLYLDWGNSLFQNGQPSDSVPIYSNVITPSWQAPTSQLYTLAGLKPGADIARRVIAALPDVSGLAVDPQIIAVVLDVRQELLKIDGNLNHWGVWAQSVPIWTFDYLQQAAVNFTQLAVSAERDVINFWNNADQATLTRQQLSDAADQAKAEVNAQQMSLEAASAEQIVYSDGLALANQRAADAIAAANQYQSLSGQWILSQALNAQLNGGDKGDSAQLTAYADTMMSGTYSLKGSRGTLAAAEQLTAARFNRSYEVDSLQRQAAELQTAATQATDEVAAATARTAAAQAALDAATTRAKDAGNDLTVFDAQTFTPDVWNGLGNTMMGIYKRYFQMALRAASLMQQAYNFETDQSLALIKDSYATDEVNGLLGADLLMADIQSFSYDLITGTVTKPQPVKQTISLAQRFGYLFESQFRTSGSMDFTTTLDDFEAAYPGPYAGRIETVEIEVDGIVPPTGISGLLMNSGISTYRVPSSAWTRTNDGRKYRVQPRETLVISDYSPRSDVLVAPTDTRMLRIFQGSGPASTWHLELLPSINDLDYGAITDVKLTFSYLARFDSDLHDRVLSEITGRPGFNARQRGIPLRWVFPDAFFAFQRSGTLSWELQDRDFPFNERSPVRTELGLIVATTGATAASGITFSLSAPTSATVSAVTDAGGTIDSNTSKSAWNSLASGSAVGPYTLTVTAAANPQLVQKGALNLAGIVNIGFILGYTFTPR